MRLFKMLVVCVMVLGLVLSLNVNLDAQEQTKMDAEMMKKWQEVMTPGPNHKYLEYFVGEWTTTSKMWMHPGAKPIESKSKGKATMIMGGRYLKSKVSGIMMNMPMEGFSINGYDNYNKKFVSFWMDTMGTGFYLASGSLDKTGKIRTETAVWDDPMAGGKMKVKLVTRIVDDNKYFFDMFMEQKGKMFKTMEMIYSRKK